MHVPRKPAQSTLGFRFLLLFSANGKSVFGDDDDRRKLRLPPLRPAWASMPRHWRIRCGNTGRFRLTCSKPHCRRS
jgi:hypothetical protein